MNPVNGFAAAVGPKAPETLPLLTLFVAWRAQVHAVLTCDKKHVIGTLVRIGGLVCGKCWLRRECQSCNIMPAHAATFHDYEQSPLIRFSRCRFCLGNGREACIFCNGSPAVQGSPDLALVHSLLSVMHKELEPVDLCKHFRAPQLLALHTLVSFDPIRAITHPSECVDQERYEPLLDAARELKQFAEEYHRPGGEWHMQDIKETGADTLLRAPEALEDMH